MAEIHLTTFIAAPADVVFDLYRHVGLHQITQQQYKEEAIRGITTGLIKKDDIVTWKAKHLGKIRFLTVKITEMDPPHFFEDTMVEGDFKMPVFTFGGIGVNSFSSMGSLKSVKSPIFLKTKPG